VSGLVVSPEDQETLVIGLIFGFMIARRAFAQLRGTPVSEGALIGYSVVYPLLFALVIGTESYPIVPLWSLAADLAAGVLGALVAIDYVGRKVTIYQEDGRWMYRLGPVVPIVYVALFIGRLVLELAIGINPFAGPSSGITPGALTVLIVVDALFGFSTGLALGRNLGVYRVFRRASAVSGAVPLRSEH
jgi:hypothetical protein